MTADARRVRNATRGTVVAERVRNARTFLARTRGLLGRSSLEPGEGLRIEPCSSIHMFFMRFAIDAIFVDREGRVTRTVENLRPWRLALGGRGARAVIELPLGTIAATRTEPGDRLEAVD